MRRRKKDHPSREKKEAHTHTQGEREEEKIRTMATPSFRRVDQLVATRRQNTAAVLATPSGRFWTPAVQTARAWWQRARHAAYWPLLACVGWGLTVLFVTLWATKHAHLFRPVYEQYPTDTSEILDCSGWTHPEAHPYDFEAQAPTTVCKFSGDFSLDYLHKSDDAAVPERIAATQAWVERLCAERRDCAGYTVRQTVPIDSCVCLTSSQGTENDHNHNCVAPGPNSGQPQYVLWSKAGVATARPVPRTVQGLDHHTRTVLFRRQG